MLKLVNRRYQTVIFLLMVRIDTGPVFHADTKVGDEPKSSHKLRDSGAQR